MRATTEDHFRMGNVNESFTTTALLQLVDQGRLSLDDPLSKFMPEIPNASNVTLGMLVRSTSGFPDYVTSAPFIDAYLADPFRQRTPSELIGQAFTRPPLFPPGTNFSFSDTNFTILGEVLSRATGLPLPELLKRQLYRPLGLRDTQMRLDAFIPKPVMHGFTVDRGTYEDSTRWSPSIFAHAGNAISDLDDLGKWARVLGEGRVLSPQSHALQTSPQPGGLGVLLGGRNYTMGSILADGWIHNNPRLLGYNGVVAYLPSKQTAVVVFVTVGPRAPGGLSFANAAFARIASTVAPLDPQHFPLCTRPPC